jgi:nucleotide-binding universal stress UspA family protein
LTPINRAAFPLSLRCGKPVDRQHAQTRRTTRRRSARGAFESHRYTRSLDTSRPVPSNFLKEHGMSYASIVFHLDQGAHLARRSDFAIHFARHLGSHLTGVAAADRTLLEMTVEAGLSLNQAFSDALLATRLRAEARANLFTDRAVVARFNDVDTVVDDDDEAAALLKRSRCCDLMILSRPDPDANGHGRAQRQLESLLLDGVAPTLVLPWGDATPGTGGHAVVGWNDTPEAARAVAAAMPLLQNARQVTLLQCHSPTHGERGRAQDDLGLPLEWLGRQGVRAEMWIESTPRDPGDVLLETVDKAGADLLVMGAWGHSRWSEKWVGGATQTVLRNARIPLLMCH